MLLSYAVLIVLYFLPVAAWYIAENVTDSETVMESLKQLGIASPLMTSFWVPLDANILETSDPNHVSGDWRLVIAYFTFTLLAIAGMFTVIAAFLKNRWGMTGR